MTIDFEKYKYSLQAYLALKGYDVKINPMFCFSPDHSNTDTPSMQIHDDGFKCHSCGIHGDIYDACGLITGLTDKKEQYRDVEQTLGFAPLQAAVKKDPDFTPDPKAVKEVNNYLKNHGGREKGVKHFLKQRGYNDEIIGKLAKSYAYWPGLDQAERSISLKTLEKAGLYNPEKEYHAYHNAGAIIRLGSGYKLMFYKNDKCEKRNSRSAKTFPCPPVDELPEEIILTEAETSALSMRSVGFENVFSTGGTNGITKNNAHLLKNVKKIIFCFDGDNKGRYHSGIDEHLIDKKTGNKSQPKTAIQKIIESGCIAAIHTVRLAENSDPDDYVREGKIGGLQYLIDHAEPVTTVTNKPLEEPEQSPEEEKDNLPFRFMGYDDKAYYILPKNQNVPLKINRGDTSLKNWMHETADEDWWFQRFNMETETKEGELKTVFDKSAALHWFRQENYKVGIYDASRLKGIGAYKDGDQIILNTGRDVVTCSGETIDYTDWDGDNIYTRSKRHFKLKANPWKIEDGKNLWNQINTFSFEKRMDKIAVAGYVVMAPFASALWRRPALWLTAKKGTGKSYLMEEIIVPAVGGGSFALFTEGTATEAFLRQMTKTDSVPIVIDEFEAKDKKEKMNNERIQDLMRSAYGGNTTGKGSASHEAIEFHLRNMFCFGSINVNISNDGNRSRLHICRMKESRGVCQAPEDFEGLRARTFKLLPKILEDIKIAKHDLMSIGLNNRQADTYSPFLAGAWSLISERSFMNESEDEKILTVFHDAIKDLFGGDGKEDEDRIIERILQQRVRIDSSNERTVAEMLIEKTDMGTLLYTKELERYGMKRFKYKDHGEVLAIALESSDIKKFLEDTAYSDYKEIIQRNQFLVNDSHPVRLLGGLTRCVLLDWKKFHDEYMGNQDEDDNFDNSAGLPDFSC